MGGPPLFNNAIHIQRKRKQAMSDAQTQSRTRVIWFKAEFFAHYNLLLLPISLESDGERRTLYPR